MPQATSDRRLTLVSADGDVQHLDASVFATRDALDYARAFVRGAWGRRATLATPHRTYRVRWTEGDGVEIEATNPVGLIVTAQWVRGYTGFNHFATMLAYDIAAGVL